MLDRVNPPISVKNGLLELPLYNHAVAAGFPTPGDEYVEGYIDLNNYLITNPPATYFTRVEGDSMTGAGINSGDLLIVDRSIQAQSGHVVIAVVNAELTVKRLIIKNSKAYLKAANPDYPTIPIEEEIELVIWGVVTYSIHRILPQNRSNYYQNSKQEYNL